MAKHGWDSRKSKDQLRTFRAACARDNLPCHLCGQPIDYSAENFTRDAFELDHFYPRSTHPELTNDPANFRPSHHQCNRARGNKAVVATLGSTSRVW